LRHDGDTVRQTGLTGVSGLPHHKGWTRAWFSKEPGVSDELGKPMDMIFQACAIVGGTLIVCQFLLTLFGLGGDHDADHGGHMGGGHDVGGHDHGGLGHGAGGHGAHGHAHTDHGSSWFFGMLTLRTVSAFAAFFGLTGLAARSAGLEDVPTVLLAIGAGLAAFFIVGWLMRLLHRLNVDGTVRIHQAVGCRGSVYLSVPGAKAGLGKVHVNVLNRSMEFQALTSQQELPTGMPIVVVGVVGPDTVEVAAALEAERNVHG
jgi:hypothetical protein